MVKVELAPVVSMTMLLGEIFPFGPAEGVIMKVAGGTATKLAAMVWSPVILAKV